MAKRRKNRESVRRRSNKSRKARKRKRARGRIKPKRYDPRLEFGLKYMREGDTLAEAAKKVGVRPAQLRSYAAATGIVIRKGGEWHFKRDRRFRRMPLYSDARRVLITVHNGRTASLVGSYMRAVKMFFATEGIDHLGPFRDQSVPDINGKRYVFETRPNVLLRLDASGVEPFELAYEIVKRE